MTDRFVYITQATRFFTLCVFLLHCLVAKVSFLLMSLAFKVTNVW